MNQGESTAQPTRKKKYLIFKLQDSEYGVPLAEVREIVGLPFCIPIPGTPPYFLGMINLRGRVISAIDLLKKLSPGTKGTTSKRPAMIITETSSITLGCAVDQILEVLMIDEAEIDRSCEIDNAVGKSFIQGIARFETRQMILIIDLVRAVDVNEIMRIRGS
jgi:purine-binding chemotaxis protein CheW